MKKGFVFWCDFKEDKAKAAGIYRIRPDGSDGKGIIRSGVGSKGIRGIAIDWLAGTLHKCHSIQYFLCL